MSLLWSLRILATSLVIPPLLRVFPLDRLAGRLGRRAGVKTPSQAQQMIIAERVDRVLTGLPRPWEHTCLTRSTVLYHLFRRSGVSVELCIGVKREGEGMAAHAWLESSGSLYLEPAGAKDFEVIARFPAVSPAGDAASGR